MSATPEPEPEPVRATLQLSGRRLSYLDSGGPGPLLLALHGHFGEARTFAPPAWQLAPDWRVVALDQRGHGHSGRPPDFSREGYVEDTAAVLHHLGGPGPAVVLGHSLGGVNAYHLAARHPRLVRALVIEDIGAEVDGDLSFCLTWPHRAPTRPALLEALGASAPHLTDAVREYGDGWGLAFRPQDMAASQRALNGDHWRAWLGSDCPALLLRGTRSGVLSARHARAMAAARPHTRLVELPTGHSVHATDPEGFAEAVRTFLGALPPHPHIRLPRARRAG
ncbi:pimeloyl-ACP methyl ester carboxylesterase [Streptomyces sp. 3211.6]|uniref:alpha/beta fold hydrolase n=1 Tax=Streptomyces sp. 3211.6 TaxID=1938845 RepID=UPI000EB12F1F|nr:alpha/beta hydrolase [Streptomyces sp. 3211.6]RKT02534.1 pimeloyl-ACP methyl ester carboxylesterase [Streptomyces sp. 3211.6]